MKSLLVKIETLLGYFLGCLMFAMVVDVSWQVITRFIVSQPSSYTEEIARYLLVWIGILGAAYAFRRHAHLGLDIVTRSLKGRKAMIAQKAADFMCLVFALSVMVIGGFNLVSLTLELNQLSAALQVRVGYIYSVIPISGVLISLFALERLLSPYSAVAEHDLVTDIK
ncbi:TRAP transporter small permease [Teredinibacter purpureus]|uniref:TRAP transporter small permease n=1 Tax=Teredinibacter purpureus TaxID=2731756 RepID=UPI0005F85B40|nr:TRAP transporter small permease [Teredinibacter purpureus]